MDIERVTFQMFSRPDQGVDAIDLAQLRPMVNFVVAKEFLYVIGQGGWGGNHRHSRREAFAAFGGRGYLMWRDKDGQQHETPMYAEGADHTLFLITPGVPHYVENRSSSEPMTLIEFRDDDMSPPQILEGAESFRKLTAS